MKELVGKYWNMIMRIAEVIFALIIAATLFYYSTNDKISMNEKSIKQNSVKIDNNTITIEVLKDWTEEMRFNLKKQMEASGLRYESIDKIQTDKRNGER